jgi:hypothetical protein
MSRVALRVEAGLCGLQPAETVRFRMGAAGSLKASPLAAPGYRFTGRKNCHHRPGVPVSAATTSTRDRARCPSGSRSAVMAGTAATDAPRRAESSCSCPHPVSLSCPGFSSPGESIPDTLLVDGQALKFVLAEARAAGDFDFLLDAISLHERPANVADTLAAPGYNVVPESRNFQFRKPIPDTSEVGGARDSNPTC